MPGKLLEALAQTIHSEGVNSNTKVIILRSAGDRVFCSGASFDELEKSVKLVEGQLQSIENFFGYLNDEIVTMSTPDKFSLLDFEQLSDSISMTKQMLDATADAMGALDAHNRQMGNYELLPGSQQ